MYITIDFDSYSSSKPAIYIKNRTLKMKLSGSLHTKTHRVGNEVIVPIKRKGRQRKPYLMPKLEHTNEPGDGELVLADPLNKDFRIMLIVPVYKNGSHVKNMHRVFTVNRAVVVPESFKDWTKGKWKQNADDDWVD